MECPPEIFNVPLILNLRGHDVPQMKNQGKTLHRVATLGKTFWKIKKIPGQGKVREFHFQSGKSRKKKKEKSQGKSKFSQKSC